MFLYSYNLFFQIDINLSLFQVLITIMLKYISLIVVLWAAFASAKSDSNGTKKDDVGTVIGIDLGVS